ncbi:MAG: DUF2807 domain-containing protein [Parvularculaceae bacterium]|nr:DUF2807 domain-containing protein [Parvularculaceae bacterium]
MKKPIVAAAIAAVLLSPALAEERSYDLDGFEGVSASAGTRVEIKIAPDFTVRAVGDSEAIDRLKIEVDGMTLEVGRKPGVNFGRNQKVTVYVTLPNLKALSVSSGADAGAAGVAGGPFALDGSSGGHAEVSGACDSLAANVSSGGFLNAERLECRTASADASSGGHLKLFVSESISADASSGGNIEVYGSPPNVDVDRSSGGSVTVK